MEETRIQERPYRDDRAADLEAAARWWGELVDVPAKFDVSDAGRSTPGRSTTALNWASTQRTTGVTPGSAGRSGTWTTSTGLGSDLAAGYEHH